MTRFDFVDGILPSSSMLEDDLQAVVDIWGGGPGGATTPSLISDLDIKDITKIHY